MLFRDAAQAALCSIRIIRKVPDLSENFMSPAAALLKEKHHGVLITGVQLCTDLCKANPEALEYLRKINSRDLHTKPYFSLYALDSGTAARYFPAPSRLDRRKVRASHFPLPILADEAHLLRDFVDDARSSRLRSL
ncbi:AP-1 complex subunit gamma-2 [Platanthera guangdongensis]|uniref:AP-1 complex subunit gamma-2 n=1 Tax=Platanthera guangdongensis TaxID=2320717 RepID=A0ABR2MF73_9ASPA